jgi:hypothetical protein
MFFSSTARSELYLTFLHWNQDMLGTVSHSFYGIEDTSMTVKCRTTIQVPLLCSLNLH